MRLRGTRGGAAVLAALALIAVTLIPLGGAEPASAATASDFRPGNIISDDNFYNGTAMNSSQVQVFLNQQGSGCTSSLCLRTSTFPTNTRPADAMCSGYSGPGSDTAANIIANVGQSCGISPKVLLVTLQKESGLVTTTSPSSTRYNVAMGYACPDTAPCDAKYYGFFNQVYSAAWQLKRYGNPAGTANTFTWYPVGSVSAVAYSPNSACGSAPVLIENKATAALYYYTPYQPNSAALNNLYGVGDGCSAYGNRNFWVFYSDWFGSPTASPYANVNSIVGQWGGVQISGWIRSPSSDAPDYIWVNVDGNGAAYSASSPLSWFPSQFPGWGPNHGFDQLVAASPGPHNVCVYRASTGSVIKCEIVTVPRNFGSFDSATAVPGGAQITGWSVDALSNGPSYFWVSVDGAGSNYQTNTSLSWLPAMFSGASTGQGINTLVKTSPGRHTICLNGPDGTSYGCRTIVAPSGSGSLDSVTGTPGTLQVSGWYVDYGATGNSWVWVTVDGQGAPYLTNTTLNWLPTYLPGFSADNGINLSIPALAGSHRVCLYGAASGALIGCRTAVVPYSAAGSVDSVTAAANSITVSGWSADLTTSAPSYIWINVDGSGGPYLADTYLNWFGAIYPGKGSNHGYSVSIPASPGSHSVCVYGAQSISLGCRTVRVG